MTTTGQAMASSYRAVALTSPRRLILNNRSPLLYTSTTHNTVRHASSKPQTDKSRILEKPTRFNPPSHPPRRARPARTNPLPNYTRTEPEKAASAGKRYPNMMPPEGTFWHWFLTERKLHLWLAFSTLTALTLYTYLLDFLHTTELRAELPSSADFFAHPLAAAAAALRVYKRHTEIESEKTARKRAMKIDDARKRKEFLREHGVEPGFLTGTWMDKFGTEEGDRWVKAREERGRKALEGEMAVMGKEEREQVALQAVLDAAAEERRREALERGEHVADEEEQQQPQRKRKFFGIW